MWGWAKESKAELEVPREVFLLDDTGRAWHRERAKLPFCDDWHASGALSDTLWLIESQLFTDGFCDLLWRNKCVQPEGTTEVLKYVSL